MSFKCLVLGLATGLVFGCSAHAAEVMVYDDGGKFDLSAGVGLMTAMGKEYVYNEDGSKLSELNWNLQSATTLNFGANFKAGPRVSLYGNATLGLNGNNYMDDYDWLQADLGLPPGPDYTDHSWHDDTQLDHYFSFDGGAKFKVMDTQNLDVSVLGGARYTDVKWTAYGGCYLYSNVSLYDSSGCFPDGERGISYQMMLPAVYGGLGLDHSGERFKMNVDFLAGMSFNASDRDNHWMRDLLFLDYGKSEPYVGIHGKMSYSMSPTIDLFLKGEWDRYFKMKGPTDEIDTITGDLTRYEGDAAGLSFYSINVSTGITVQF
jgi:outer membrane protease